MVKHNGRKIIYTFRYGRCLTKADKIVSVAGLVFLLVIMICVFVFGYLAYDIVYACFMFSICGILEAVFLSMAIYHWRKDKRTEKEILKCLTDEHLFKATAIPYEFDKIMIKAGYAYKCAVNFEKDGETYRQVTSNFDSLGGVYKGKKFDKDKEITFLYSPKYGEVMVFENEQGNK